MIQPQTYETVKATLSPTAEYIHIPGLKVFGQKGHVLGIPSLAHILVQGRAAAIQFSAVIVRVAAAVIILQIRDFYLVLLHAVIFL